MAKGSLDATQYPIAKIFSNDFIFNIPRYQRPYAWTTRHAGDLLDDLITFLGDEKNIHLLAPYFMGSIVLVELEKKPNVAVVDGQQRLITLTILLSVLRSLVPDTEARELTTYLLQEGSAILGTYNQYRINLRKQDMEFFQKYIQKEGGLEELKSLDPIELSDSQKNIYNNARLFLDRLSKYPEDQLVRLSSAIITKCFLVVISSSDTDSAYRIFSILNGRGLNISMTDILKSDILSKIPSYKEEDYTDKWEDIEEQLGRDMFEGLFSYIRMIHRKIKPRGTILAEIREYIRPTENPEQFIDDLLCPYSVAFNNILQANYQSSHSAEATSLNDLFRWLNRIDNAD